MPSLDARRPGRLVAEFRCAGNPRRRGTPCTSCRRSSCRPASRRQRARLPSLRPRPTAGADAAAAGAVASGCRRCRAAVVAPARARSFRGSSRRPPGSITTSPTGLILLSHVDIGWRRNVGDVLREKDDDGDRHDESEHDDDDELLPVLDRVRRGEPVLAWCSWSERARVRAGSIV